MAKIYRSQNIESRQSRVVVIHCSDPRYQPHFQDFLRRGLSLTHYGLIAVPGGAQMLSPSEVHSSLRDHGGVWFEFMAKLMDAERCILIGHADCRWYLEKVIAYESSRLKETEGSDLYAVQKEIQRRFPGIRTEVYFAEIQGSQAEFTTLQLRGSVQVTADQLAD